MVRVSFKRKRPRRSRFVRNPIRKTRGRFTPLRRRIRSGGYRKSRGTKPARTIGGFLSTQIVKFRGTDIFTFVTTANAVLAYGDTNGTNKNYVQIQADNPQSWDKNKMSILNKFQFPVNWLAWANLYSKYRVLGSKCKLEVYDNYPVNTSGTGGAVPTPSNGYIIGIVLDDNQGTGLPASNNALMEVTNRKFIKWKHVPSTTVNRTPRISMGYSPKKFFDVYDAKAQEELTYATTTVPATNQNKVGFYPFLANEDNATALTIKGRITVEYTVEFFDMNLAQAITTSA